MNACVHVAVEAGVLQGDLVHWYLDQQHVDSAEALLTERSTVNQACVLLAPLTLFAASLELQSVRTHCNE